MLATMSRLRRYLKRALIVIAILLALFALRLAVESRRSRTAPQLGATDGELRPCPSSPNCVSSQSQAEQRGIQPLRLAPSATMLDIKAALERMPGTRIIESRDGYLRAECQTLLFRFIDDLELVAHPDGIVHVRSASRVGHSDLGANRRRVERLRTLLQPLSP